MYVLDANVFITASRSYYSFDFAKKFWDFLVEKAKENIVGSVDKVHQELKKGDDELKKWADADFKKYFYSTKSNDILSEYKKLVSEVNNSSQYIDKAKEEFAQEDNADAWVIAYALARDYKVVTLEKSKPASTKKVYMPDVCMRFNVEFLDTFQLLKYLGFEF